MAPYLFFVTLKNVVGCFVLVCVFVGMYFGLVFFSSVHDQV